MKRRAFTLLELLAVVAIISILVSLMLPGLLRARGSAKGAVCNNNLHQLGLAASMYWNDHDGNSFPYKSGATNNGDIYWFGWIERGAEGTRRFDPSPGVLYPYVRDSVKVCPQFNYSFSSYKSKATGASYGYGYNIHLVGKKIASLQRPEQLALFADAAQVNTFQPPASPENPMIEEFYYISADEPTVHFRHNHSAFAAFCDGHTELRKPAANTLDQRLPAVEVGQLAGSALRPQ